MYQFGFGCNKCIDLAKHHYQLAINQGLPDAYYQMGSLYEEENISEAIRYYKLGSLHGDGSSNAILAEMRSRGSFLKNDSRKYFHYTKV